MDIDYPYISDHPSYCIVNLGALAHSGACLKKSNFAKSLKFLTKSEKLKNINLRSFRSGIPSLLERNPDLANDSHIKIWGRWKSKSYQTYMKGGNIGKKWIYQKIVAALLNEF